jgi:CRP-like cAMP-binding protein
MGLLASGAAEAAEPGAGPRFDVCDDPAGQTRVVEGSLVWPGMSDPCAAGGMVALRGDLTVDPRGKDLTRLACICVVSGNLTIRGAGSLKGLEGLRGVGGDVTLEASALASLEGLEGLQTVGGDLVILENPALPDLRGLDTLTEVRGDVTVSGNAGLREVGGLDALESIGGDLEVHGNDQLAAIEGLRALTTVGGEVRVDENQVLNAAVALAALASLGQGEQAATADDEAPRAAPAPTRASGWATALWIVGGLVALLAVSAWVVRRKVRTKPEEPARPGAEDFKHLRFAKVARAERELPEALDGLPEDAIAAARPHISAVSAEYGDVLMGQDDVDGSAAWVIDGELEVTSGGVQVGRVGAGELVGEMSLIDQVHRGVVVTAVSKTRLLVVERSGYDAMKAANNPVARVIEQVSVQGLGRKLRDTSRRIAGEGTSARSLQDAEPEDIAGRLEAFGRSLVPDAVEFSHGTPAQILSRTPVFGAMPPVFLEFLGNHMQVRDHLPGEPLVVQGEPGTEVFVLAAGRVDLFLATADQPELIRIDDLHPGDVFGMDALFSGSRPASAVALTRTRTLVLSAHQTQVLMSTDEAVGRAFRVSMILALAASLREANAHLSGDDGGATQGANLHRARAVMISRRLDR